MQQSHEAAHCVPDGPMRVNCWSTTMHEIGLCGCLHTIIFTLLWASSSSLARRVYLYHRPVRANCLSTTMHEMGPCRCLCMIIFMLLWASSNSSARTVHSHHRPMRANCLSTTVHEIGPCKWLCVIAFRLLGLTQAYQQGQYVGIMGQCKYFSQQPFFSLKGMPAHTTVS